jgi:hypothetical protein
MIVGVAISAGSTVLLANPEAIVEFFASLAQTFTLDDLARGILDNDELGLN